MGLFDEVVGAFLKGDAGKYQAILSWVEEQGGIQVLLEKLQSGGLGAILSTWLSNHRGINRLVASNWNRRSAQMRCPILDKNLAWIPVQLPVYWQNNCRRLLMRSHRKVKCLHKPITICFPQAWNC
ncbi:radical SAM domain-containing protein [Escherichia coli]|uniref:Radical SAM domain-containing protein n=1 Tax=Escherichia coli TaxID=562 RepID=A0A377C8N0_ECOLX|nr:radical SAM domain-containing protein [Escherichia coli]